jgi:WD40 repeat protein
LFGKESDRAHSYYGLQSNVHMNVDSFNLFASNEFWAMPLFGSGGGSILVRRLGAYGKVALSGEELLNGHKQRISSCAFSPFHKGLMCTGSEDSTIMVWDVEKLVERNTSCTNDAPVVASSVLEGHTHGVRELRYHPTARNLLVSLSSDATVKVWDVARHKNTSVATFRPELNNMAAKGFNEESQNNNNRVANISLSYDGSRIALGCKSEGCMVFDMRVRRKEVAASPRGALGRHVRCEWLSSRCGADPGSQEFLLVVSSTSTGARQLALFDPRVGLHNPLCTRVVDTAAGQLFPICDNDLGLVFLAGKGDSAIKCYELADLNEGQPETEQAFAVQHCSDYRQSVGTQPIAGLCLLPKSQCKVRDIEVCAFYLPASSRQLEFSNWPITLDSFLSHCLYIYSHYFFIFLLIFQVGRLLKLCGDSVSEVSFSIPRADVLVPYFQDDLYPDTPSWLTPACDAAAFAAEFARCNPVEENGGTFTSEALIAPSASEGKGTTPPEDAAHSVESEQALDTLPDSIGCDEPSDEPNKAVAGDTVDDVPCAPETKSSVGTSSTPISHTWELPLAPNLESLRPEGMQALSDRTEDERNSVTAPSQSRLRNLKSLDAEKRRREEARQSADVFKNLQQLAVTNSKYNPNASMGHDQDADVSEDEWSD